jgi:hypothetical protein
MIKTWNDYDVPYKETDQRTPFKFPRLGNEIYARGEISRLTNSIHYFLDYVYIIAVENGFHLVVIHRQQVMMDKVFKSVRSAKIAFSKLFKDKTWKENIQVDWSCFYSPEKYWILDKNQTVLRSRTSCPTGRDLIE